MPVPIEALPRTELEHKYRRSRGLAILLSILSLALLAGLVVQWPKSEDPAQQAAAQEEQNSLERRQEGDPMAIGDVDAPIVMSEWIDFRCPYCAVYARDTFPAIMQEYVESGKVRIEIHDVAFFGEESLRAAAAARAAGEQGRYFEFVEAVYAVAPESGHPELPEAELVELAKTAGVPDIERFKTDLNSPELRAAVEQSTAMAQQVGVTSVPFFAVNGQGLSGAQPIEQFRTLLDQSGE